MPLYPAIRAFYCLATHLKIPTLYCKCLSGEMANACYNCNSRQFKTHPIYPHFWQFRRDRPGEPGLFIVIVLVVFDILEVLQFVIEALPLHEVFVGTFLDNPARIHDQYPVRPSDG